MTSHINPADCTIVDTMIDGNPDPYLMEVHLIAEPTGELSLLVFDITPDNTEGHSIDASKVVREDFPSLFQDGTAVSEVGVAGTLDEARALLGAAANTNSKEQQAIDYVGQLVDCDDIAVCDDERATVRRFVNVCGDNISVNVVHALIAMFKDSGKWMVTLPVEWRDGQLVPR